MRLVETTVAPSPLDGTRIRAACAVAYAGGRREHYWFDLPATLRDFLATDADPWIVLLFPIALYRNEGITSDLSMDERLARNLRRINRIWRLWHSSLSTISIDAPSRASSDQPRERDRSVCAFFSGGVDSLFTILHRRQASAATGQDDIRDLLSVWGFNLPLDRPAEFQRLIGRLRPMARVLGKRLAGCGKRSPWRPDLVGSQGVSTRYGMTRCAVATCGPRPCSPM